MFKWKLFLTWSIFNFPFFAAIIAYNPSCNQWVKCVGYWQNKKGEKSVFIFNNRFEAGTSLSVLKKCGILKPIILTILFTRFYSKFLLSSTPKSLHKIICIIHFYFKSKTRSVMPSWVINGFIYSRQTKHSTLPHWHFCLFQFSCKPLSLC